MGENLLFPVKVLNLTDGFKPFNLLEIDYNCFKFPGGELQFILKDILSSDIRVLITSRLNSSDDLIKLSLASDALKRHGIKYVNAFLPYFPYARQDRVANYGEAFSLKVITDFINRIGFNTVQVFDPHSDVVVSLLDNVSVITNLPLVKYVLRNFDFSKIRLVAPDAGSHKKIYKLAMNLRYKHDIISASKIRNTETGEITNTAIDAVQLDPELSYFVIDDICDGGRTFVNLAEELKNKGAEDLYLIVSHGIFSNGYTELYKYYNGIFSSDSISSDNSKIHIPFSQFL